MKYLPKAAQAVISFQNPTLISPVREKKHYNRSLSGPMIPFEARGRSKNFEAQEPTSPKVSCLGQIKHNKKLNEKKLVSHPRRDKLNKTRLISEMKKNPWGFKKIFAIGKKSDALIDQRKQPIPDRAPSLSHMRRFSSSRDFDWKNAQVAPVGDRDYYSNEEEFGYGENHVVTPVPVAAVKMVDGGGAGSALQPRKEINLWKRRTMAQPKPLQLNGVTAK